MNMKADLQEQYQIKVSWWLLFPGYSKDGYDMTPVSVLITSWSNHIPVHYKFVYVESDIKLNFQNLSSVFILTR